MTLTLYASDLGCQQSPVPEKDGGSFKLSDRTSALLKCFSGHPSVRVFYSQVTLEYDLAAAAVQNSEIMAKVWESCFVSTPGTFNLKSVQDPSLSASERALATWRGICRANPAVGKAEFADRLADHLQSIANARGASTSQPTQPPSPTANFVAPQYFLDALAHVAQIGMGPGGIGKGV